MTPPARRGGQNAVRGPTPASSSGPDGGPPQEEQHVITVSTDGSCLRNPGGAIGWAWVDHAGGSASGGAVSGTNQIAELMAVLD